MKYLKWIFGTSIANKENENFEINKVINADKWDPTNADWEQKGGFNFTNEKCALRWMSRGDTLYEVEIPEDGEIYEIENSKTPGGIIIANKIILRNPINISPELLDYYYEISELPLNTYFECIGLLASRSYYLLAQRIINDKITIENIDKALFEFNNSIKPWHKVDYDCYNKVKEILEKIKKEKNMKNELIIKKCLKCGALVEVIKDCNCENCGIKCCGEEMTRIIPNSVDCDSEKHIPTYKRVEDEIYVEVNHVMEKDHYIEWIAMVKDTKIYKEMLYPEQKAECRFKYLPNSKIYAYCNKHELWKANVE